jgi:hypothetical protein
MSRAELSRGIAAGHQVIFEFAARDIPSRLQRPRPACLRIDLERAQRRFA